MKRRHAAILIASLPLTWSTAARAQGWPDRPIRLVVPYPPGASTDAMGRIVAQAIAGPLGQSVVVDNRAGASGSIGSDFVAKSPPDGYTFVLGTDASHSANYHLSATPPYHPVKDFTPLTLGALNPIVLVTNPTATPAANLAELMAAAKADPKRGAYGSSGIGSPHHLSGELLSQRSGAPLTHVPYKGGGPAVTDLLGGNVPMVFSSLITVLPHIRSGRLRAIAVTGTRREAALPDVPTLAETYPGTEMNSWLGFWAPANLPPAIAQRLSDEIIRALRNADARAKLEAAGLVVVALSPAETQAVVAREFEARGQLIRAAGIKAE